jgi:hypothetical protein
VEYDHSQPHCGIGWQTLAAFGAATDLANYCHMLLRCQHDHQRERADDPDSFAAARNADSPVTTTAIASPTGHSCNTDTPVLLHETRCLPLPPCRHRACGMLRPEGCVQTIMHLLVRSRGERSLFKRMGRPGTGGNSATGLARPSEQGPTLFAQLPPRRRPHSPDILQRICAPCS